MTDAEATQALIDEMMSDSSDSDVLSRADTAAHEVEQPINQGGDVCATQSAQQAHDEVAADSEEVDALSLIHIS